MGGARSGWEHMVEDAVSSPREGAHAEDAPEGRAHGTGHRPGPAPGPGPTPGGGPGARAPVRDTTSRGEPDP